MAFNQSAKQVTATIQRIDAKKLRGDIQRAIIHVIGHAMEYGTSPLVEKLNDQLQTTPMLRKLAPMVSGYLVKHGPFVYAKATGWQFSKAKKASMIEDEYSFEEFEASAPMWDDAEKAEKKDVTLDAFKELAKLIDRLEKKSIDGKVVDAALIPYLKALSGQYAGRKVVEEAQAKEQASADAAKAFAEEIRKVEAEGETASA